MKVENLKVDQWCVIKYDTLVLSKPLKISEITLPGTNGWKDGLIKFERNTFYHPNAVLCAFDSEERALEVCKKAIPLENLKISNRKNERELTDNFMSTYGMD